MRRRNATPKVGGPGQAEELRGASQKATIRMGALVCRKRRLHPPLLADVLQPMRRRLGDDGATTLRTDGGRIGDGTERLRNSDRTRVERYGMQTITRKRTTAGPPRPVDGDRRHGGLPWPDCGRAHSRRALGPNSCELNRPVPCGHRPCTCPAIRSVAPCSRPSRTLRAGKPVA